MSISPVYFHTVQSQAVHQKLMTLTCIQTTIKPIVSAVKLTRCTPNHYVLHTLRRVMFRDNINITLISHIFLYFTLTTGCEVGRDSWHAQCKIPAQCMPTDRWQFLSWIICFPGYFSFFLHGFITMAFSLNKLPFKSHCYSVLTYDCLHGTQCYKCCRLATLFEFIILPIHQVVMNCTRIISWGDSKPKEEAHNQCLLESLSSYIKGEHM